MLTYLRHLERLPIWNITNGPHMLDIIPYEAGPNDPQVDGGSPTYVLTLDVHYKNGKTIVCLGNYDKRCPICDYSESLAREDSCLQLARLYRRKRRCLYNVVVLDSRVSERKGVQILETSHWMFERQLLALARPSHLQQPRLESVTPSLEEVFAYLLEKEVVKKGEIGKKFTHFSDPDEGYSIAFSRTGKGPRLRNSNFQFVERERTIQNKLLQDAYCLDDLICIPSFAKVYDFLYESQEWDKCK